MHYVHRSLLGFIALAIFLPCGSHAFCNVQKYSAPLTTTSSLGAGGSNDTLNRRSVFRKISGVAFGVVTFVSRGQEARASYSAYTNREKDWQERQEKGEIQFSSARDLKAQLKEIAPMNSEKSKIFCPNGSSSNVDPMMENKCSDRMALPSVYGRTEDIVGNSIPGFRGGKYGGIDSGSSTSLTAEAGGFPKYK